MANITGSCENRAHRHRIQEDADRRASRLQSAGPRRLSGWPNFNHAVAADVEQGRLRNLFRRSKEGLINAC